MLGLRKFKGLFWTQFLGAFNDNFFKNALVLLITYRSTRIGTLSPPEMVALSGAIFILPYFLFSAWAGQLADKLSKTSLTQWIKIAEIVNMTFAAIGFIFNSIPFLMLVLFLMGTQSTFFGPIKYAILPELLTDEELLSGNAWVEMGSFVAILLGTVVGGLSIALEDGIYWVSAGGIGFSVFGYLASKTIPATVPRSPKLSFQWNLLSETLKLWPIIKEVRSVFIACNAIAWFWGFGAVLLSLFPIYGKQLIGGNEIVVTWLLALFSIGIGVGSLLCSKFSRGKINLNFVFWGGLGMCLFLFDVSWIEAPRAFKVAVMSEETISLGEFLSYPISYRITLDFFLLSVFSGLFIVPLYTIMQRDAVLEHRSRVIAGNNVLSAIAMVGLSLILTWLLGKAIEVPKLYMMLGISHLAVVSWTWKTIQTLRPES